MLLTVSKPIDMRSDTVWLAWNEGAAWAVGL